MQRKVLSYSQINQQQNARDAYPYKHCTLFAFLVEGVFESNLIVLRNFMKPVTIGAKLNC